MGKQHLSRDDRLIMKGKLQGTRENMDMIGMVLQDKFGWHVREETRCSRCGKKLSDGWKRKTCLECLTYSRRKTQERRREKGQKTWDMRCQDGVCFVCGAKSMEGKRMCQACYDKRVPISIENLKKAVDTGKRV